MFLTKSKKPGFDKRIGDVSSLWISQLGAVGIAFVTQLLLARMLKIEEYGAFSAAFNITSILGGVASFGAGQNWLRIFGVEGWNGFRWVRPTIKVNLLIILLSVLLVIIVVPILNVSYQTKWLMYMFISTIITLGLGTSAEAVYQLEEKYKNLAALKFSIHGMRFAVVIIALVFGSASLTFIGIGYSFISVLLLIVYVYIIKRLCNKEIDLKGHSYKDITYKKVPDFLETFRCLLPYGSAGIFYLIYFQSNIFILGNIMGEQSVAIYNVAFTIINVVFLFPTTFYQSYLVPKIHRWGINNEDKIPLLYEKGTKLVVILGIVIMYAVMMISPVAIPILFGNRYTQSSLLLILLCLTIPVRLICNNLGSILVTEKHVTRKAYYQMIGAIVSIVTNIILIKILGIYGAPLAIIITELIVTLLFIIGVKKYVPLIKKHHIKNIKSYIYLLILGMTTGIFYFYMMINGIAIVPIIVVAILVVASLWWILKLIKSEGFSNIFN